MACLYWMSRTSSLPIDVTRRGGLPAALAFLFLIFAAMPLRANDAPAEPPDYKMDDYRSPTPATLDGAKVVTVQQAYKTWHEGKTIFIDVMPRPPKPNRIFRIPPLCGITTPHNGSPKSYRRRRYAPRR